jgi:hypothetical protein
VQSALCESCALIVRRPFTGCPLLRRLHALYGVHDNAQSYANPSFRTIGGMSALGQKQTCAAQHRMSALGGKADIMPPSGSVSLRQTTYLPSHRTTDFNSGPVTAHVVKCRRPDLSALRTAIRRCQIGCPWRIRKLRRDRHLEETAAMIPPSVVIKDGTGGRRFARSFPWSATTERLVNAIPVIINSEFFQLAPQVDRVPDEHVIKKLPPYLSRSAVPRTDGTRVCTGPT